MSDSYDIAADRDINTVPSIIILTHGRMGEELIKSTSMIFGQLQDVHALPLEVGDDPDEYRKRLDHLLDSVPQGSIVMVDLFGGTPSNALMLLAKRREVFALSGVNMPMLIEAASVRNVYSGQQLLDYIVDIGHSGIVNITDLVSRQSA
jgi:PTS system mannose-specific IIA component/D-glucosaminate-specific PTS system IIA component